MPSFIRLTSKQDVLLDRTVEAANCAMAHERLMKRKNVPPPPVHTMQHIREEASELLKKKKLEKNELNVSLVTI